MVLHSVLLDADLPSALPPGPSVQAYQRKLERLAAQYGLACNGAPEILLTHAPDVLLEEMQQATPTALWSPVGNRTGIYHVATPPPLLVTHTGSAVMLCLLNGKIVG